MFVALAFGCKEAEWIRNILYEIPLGPNPMSQVYIDCDSQLFVKLIAMCIMVNLDILV